MGNLSNFGLPKPPDAQTPDRLSFPAWALGLLRQMIRQGSPQARSLNL